MSTHPGMRVLDFRDHRRELNDNFYVYAVASRRARGLSIGINLNPDKACNFDCPYCQVDRSISGRRSSIDIGRLVAELELLIESLAPGAPFAGGALDTVTPDLRRVADIAFAGDGEPTIAPAFAEAARATREVRDRNRLAVPLRLLTNATLLHRPRVRAGLVHFDELWCKLDAGTPDYFRFVDGTRFSFERVLANLGNLARERPIVIQSLFPAFRGVGPSDAEIDAWAGRLRDVLAGGGSIDHVQVYTVARRPADPRVTALPGKRLEEIAARVRALGLRAEVYAG